ncbi:hypothetical protein D3C76_676390 [compost metagenome]
MLTAHDPELHAQISLGVDLGVIAADLFPEGFEVPVDSKAREGIGQLRSWPPLLDMQLTQLIGLHATGDPYLFQLRICERLRTIAQASHQDRPVPAQGFFGLVGPGASTVMFKPWCIGIRAARVLDTVLPIARVLPDDKMIIAQRQDVLIVVTVQAQLVGL